MTQYTETMLAQIETKYPNRFIIDTRLFSSKDQHWRVSCECVDCGKINMLSPISLQCGSKCKFCLNTQIVPFSEMPYNCVAPKTKLYYLHFKEHNAYKIGITMHNVKTRFRGINPNEYDIVFEKEYKNRSMQVIIFLRKQEESQNVLIEMCCH